MRLPELCLALLCAAGTSFPGVAQKQSSGLGAAVERAAEAERGEPAAVAPRASGVDPRQAWMLLAGSTGRPSGSGARGRTGAGTAPVPASSQSPGRSAQTALQVGVRGAAPVRPSVPAVLEELQLLLKGMVKEQIKTQRKAGEQPKEEEESSKGNQQTRSPCRVEAAFHCWTRENISVEQRARQELQLYYIPERERMFHRGLGLNLTSGQYTAPITGYYTFATTLHIVRREQRRKMQSCRGNRLRVLICVQSQCQHNSNLETMFQLGSGTDLFTISVTGVLYLQAGQYASVFVDNAARSPLTIQSGSDFSAVLLGV